MLLVLSMVVVNVLMFITLILVITFTVFVILISLPRSAGETVSVLNFCWLDLFAQPSGPPGTSFVDPDIYRFYEA